MSEHRTSIASFRNDMAELLNAVAYRGDRVVLERRGKAVAAVIPMEEFEMLERIIQEREDALDARAAKAARNERGSVSLDHLAGQLGIALPGRRRQRKSA